MELRTQRNLYGAGMIAGATLAIGTSCLPLLRFDESTPPPKPESLVLEDRLEAQLKDDSLILQNADGTTIVFQDLTQEQGYRSVDAYLAQQFRFEQQVDSLRAITPEIRENYKATLNNLPPEGNTSKETSILIGGFLLYIASSIGIFFSTKETQASKTTTKHHYRLE